MAETSCSPKINKNCGAHQKNFNEDRLMLSAAECRPVSIVSKNIRYMRICVAYCCTMLCKARLWDCMSFVRLCDFHTGWNTSKIIARQNSLGSLLSLTPTGAAWWNGNTPKMCVQYGWGQMKLKKPWFSLLPNLWRHWAAINRCHARMESHFTI